MAVICDKPSCTVEFERGDSPEEKRYCCHIHKTTGADIRNMLKGVPVIHARRHHVAMREILFLEGRAKPEEDNMSLSMINPCSKDAYWGYGYDHSRRTASRLSTNTNDYIWEPWLDNMARQRGQLIQMYIHGIVDENGEPIEGT